MDAGSAKTVAKLLSPSDWENWDNDFKAKAVGLQLWDHINPDKDEAPLEGRPERPRISDFQKAHPVFTPGTSNSQSQAGSNAGQTQPGSVTTQSQTLDHQHSQHSETPVPATIFTDMSTEDQRNYQFLLNSYHQDCRRYQTQVDRVHALTTWMQDTVSPSYRKTCCKPTESLRSWYSKLRSLVQLDDVRLEADLLDRYEKIIRPMTRPPTNFDAWLRSWLAVMADAEDKGMQFADRPSMWCRQFMKAIRQVKPMWEMMYSATYKPRINDGTLDYHTVANDFQEELNKDKSIKRAPVKKGAFGPTYDGEGDEQARKTKEKSMKSPRKRKNDESKKATCPVCEKPRCKGLEHCAYAFPENAPEGWKEYEPIRKVAAKNLAKQHIRDKIAAIKRKRVRFNSPPITNHVTELPDD